MKLNVTKNFNLNNISLDLSRELNIGIDMIAADIEQGIDQGGNMGKSFERNAPMTIKKKGFDHPLLETGNMKNADKMIKSKATKTHQTATLKPSPNNINKVVYNNFGTPTIPKREFWGISKDSEKKILAAVNQKLEREINNA